MINHEDMTKINKEGRYIVRASSENSCVMVVDDHPLSLLHAVDLISYEGHKIIEVNDSTQVLSLAYQQKPDIILMDVMMPLANGLEIAKKLKLHPHTKSIPIVLMSVTDEPHLRDQALEIGVEDILMKPLQRTTLSAKLRNLAQQKRLNEGLNQTQQVLLTLASAIKNRVANEQKSSFNLANLVMGFAEYLKLKNEEIEDLVFAAYLHDIGTVNIPENILTKQGKLTPAEQLIVRQHVIIGEQICQPLCHNNPNLQAIIRHHHEKYDGSGYPDNLVADNIPYLAQVFQVIDIYHALTSKRSYKVAYSRKESLAILAREVTKGWRNPILFQQFQDFIHQY